METAKVQNKGKMFTSVSIGAAAVWFSTHCGAGFASGTQELQYFVNHGWYGFLFPLLTIFVIAVTYYVACETARQTDKWNYHDWSLEAYKPVQSVWWIFLEISIVIGTIAATAACISAGATLGNQQFGLPMWVGSVFMFVVVTMLCIFGEKVVRASAMAMTVGIIVIMLIIVIAGIIKFGDNISYLISTRYVNPEASKWGVTGALGTTPANLGNSLLWALTYAGFQMTIVAGMSSSFKGAKSKRETKGAVIFGYVLNVIMLSGVCLLIMGGMPEVYTDEKAKVLPTLFMVNQLDMPILSVLYPLLLLLALVTTAVGTVFGIVERVNPYVLKNMQNVTARKAIITIATLVVCYGISLFGLMWVVQVAYRYLGIWNWFAVIIPLLTIGYRNIHARDVAARESASSAG